MPRRGLLARRVRFLRAVLVLALLVVAARLVDVQILHGSTYARQGRQELSQAVVLPALRGTISDRDGVVLATSVPTDMVVADDFQISHPAVEARRLAPFLGLSAATLESKLSERSGYVPLADHLATAKAAKVSSMAFPGITMIADSVRVDPDGALASPVIGTVNGSGAGAAGLEYADNKVLAGRAGHETLLESPTGVQLPGTPVEAATPAAAGEGLELTLDVALQNAAEQDLAKEILASHAQSGEAVVENVKTGQILAMASLVATPAGTATTATTAPAPSTTTAPTTGPVDIGAKGSPIQEAPGNLATNALYEPGSVFKLVTFSAALADGLISPTSTITVPDQIELDGSMFHDSTAHPTETLTATQVLAESSNVGTTEIAEELGETRLLDQVGQLGFSGTPPLDFPGSSPALLVGPTQWEPTDFASLAIGQVDAVSPLQVLDAYNSVADGGEFVTPSLVKDTVLPDGTKVPAKAPATRRDMPATTASTLTQMLEQVVDTGTGVAAAVPGYLVAGKTGTAQIPADNGQAGYVTGAYNATFVGFAPANNPVLSAIVVLNRPTPIYGGAVAAPVFSEIMSYALHRYDVPTSPGLDGKPQVQAPSTLEQLVREST